MPAQPILAGMRVLALVFAILSLPACAALSPMPQTLPDEFMGRWQCYSEPFDLVFLPGNVIKTIPFGEDKYLPGQINYKVIHRAGPREFYLIAQGDYRPQKKLDGTPMVSYRYLHLTIGPPPYPDDYRDKELIFHYPYPSSTEEEWDTGQSPQKYWGKLQKEMEQFSTMGGSRTWYIQPYHSPPSP
ncbi:MAG: hypothetical protein H6868_04795 [Rhodospirillales bacterium]|nr:hypothetical protein [Rhodospirillales bacterium]